MAQERDLTPEEEQYLNAARAVWDSLDRQQGDITLLDDVVTLSVPDSFFYLNSNDTEKILVDIWGNPPGAGANTLGMLFPSGSTPFDEEAWGVTIEFEEDGYVSDENVDELDYDELLSQMKEDTRAANDERVRQGYGSIELVGWASSPFYDQESHKLYWAKELRFGDQPINTLNYNIRLLGRKGVLVLNFIAGMDQKPFIDSKLDTVLALAEFNQGSRYEDFDPSLDKVAAYGIGALIAGKVLAKAGFLAVALVFLKKFGVIILAGVAALLAKFFKRKKSLPDPE
ncbi:MAG: DUF2167 domain-containing protein [Nitrospirota bacterium]|nr:DUF2167 domain-containing protein [Nitrospirota bacterium]